MRKMRLMLALAAASPSLFACGIEISHGLSSLAPIGEDILLHEGQSASTSKLSFQMAEVRQKGHDNHVLELDFDLRISNRSDISASFSLTGAKAYGNQEELAEEVLEAYDPSDKSKNAVFGESRFDLGPASSATIEFILAIQDGNPDAKYEVSFALNEAKVSLFPHEEGYEPERFTYVHDPTLYSKVLDDAEVDEKAIYGFKPNATGSLKQYVDYNWENADDVASYKKERIKYITENDQIVKELERKLREEGKSIEEIARACSKQRNQNRLDQYKDDPEGLAKLKERNFEQYGHEDGPTPDELYEKYGSWEKVLEKCYSTNAGMDACCGVYDMFFCVFVPLAY